MNTTMTIKGTELHRLLNKTDTASLITESFSERIRNRPETDLNRLKRDLLQAGEKVVEADFINYFKELERLGIGQIIYFKETPTKFAWFYNLKNIAEAAKKKKDLVVKAAKSGPVSVHYAPEVATERVQQQSTAAVPRMSMGGPAEGALLMIPLQSGFAEIRMPQGFDEGDIQKVTSTLMRLLANQR